MVMSFTTADLCFSESPEYHENVVEPAANEAIIDNVQCRAKSCRSGVHNDAEKYLYHTACLLQRSRHTHNSNVHVASLLPWYN